MRKKTFVILSIVLLSLPMMMVNAQGEGEDKELSGSYLITLPEGWQWQEDAEGTYTATKGELTLELILPDTVRNMVSVDETSDSATVLLDMFEKLNGNRPSSESVSENSKQEWTFSTYDYVVKQNTLQGLALVTRLTPGEFVWFNLTAPELDQASGAEVLAIIMSLRQSSETAPAETVITGEPCLVQASEAMVSLRVGPGLNRGVFSEMEVGVPVPVLGKAIANDGSLWWRLDVPAGSAAELWVADTDIEKQGDCDLVVDVNAPPIIPAAPSVESGNEGEASGETADTAPAYPPGTPVRFTIKNATAYVVDITLVNSDTGEEYWIIIAAGGTWSEIVKTGMYIAQVSYEGLSPAPSMSLWDIQDDMEIVLQSVTVK